MKRPTTGRQPLATPAFRVALALLLAAGVGACGKKGAPLPPLIELPLAPDRTAARRQGEQVAFQFRVPEANTNGRSPADVRKVEVYAYTGAPLVETDVAKLATRLVTVPVRKPPEEPEEGAAPPPAAKEPGSMETGFAQGEVMVARETIGPAQFAPVVPRKKVRETEPVFEVAPPLGPPPAETLPTRAYLAVGVNRKGRRGPFSAAIRVPLVTPPSAPSAPVASYTEKSVTLTWTPPADLRRPTIQPPGEGVLAAVPLGMPSAPGGYNVYRVPPPDGATPADDGPVSAAAMASPLNETLLLTSSFEDPNMEFGQARCYLVRAVSQFGGASIESEPSPVVCATPADTFPPAAPSGLAAVSSEGVISLIWDGVDSADLGGYLVLRSEGGGDFAPLTPEPLAETTFRDERVTRGVTYAYVVVAVDRAGNRSPHSNRVEETGR